MAQLVEELYCHQQICIPPTFPYLLKQYAKAAIRSQPTDLLKWSTAYFRCLALNVPPPVKPRLEYPIPRDYLGVTPGWLKALNYQLQNCKTVNFKILWDRWIGSCLEHNTLLQVLCLGGFNNPEAIPWYKFLGLCAGFLNDNLTQTMIMFCEIITEEPEGGSAMITLASFLEVYKFLAMIDASQPQILPNLYFTDDLLGLEVKVKKPKKKKRKIELSASAESSTRSVEEVVEEEEMAISIKDEGSVVSCPNIASDEILREKERVPHEELDDLDFIPVEKESSDHLEDEEILFIDEDLIKLDQADRVSIELGEEGEDHLMGEEDEHKPKPKHVDLDELDHDDDHDELEDKDMPLADEDIDLEGKPVHVDDEEVITEDLTGDEKSHEELPEGEVAIGGGFGTEAVEEEEEEVGYDDLEQLEKALKAEYGAMTKREEEVKEDVITEAEEERKIEEVSVPAVPGIGPKVPDNLVEAVERYLKRVAAEEHGMTMPRHIRHYTCPPLEVLEYNE